MAKTLLGPSLKLVAAFLISNRNPKTTKFWTARLAMKICYCVFVYSGAHKTAK